MTIFADSSILDYGCGVTVVGQFKNYKYHNLPLQFKIAGSGTGYYISSFINTDICKKAYKFIKKNYKITYQSTVQVNQNTGNRFFFIVYRKK